MSDRGRRPPRPGHESWLTTASLRPSQLGSPDRPVRCARTSSSSSTPNDRSIQPRIDAALRGTMRLEISELHQSLGKTMIYVTHDQVEAMTMGDRVAVLKDGELQQVAPPRELYDAPANEFVAGFIGSPAMNIFDYNGGRVGVRPEKMFINKGPVGFQGVVDIVEELGAESYVYVTVGENRFVARAEGTPPQRGEDVVLTFNPREALRFDPETGRRISQD